MAVLCLYLNTILLYQSTDCYIQQSKLTDTTKENYVMISYINEVIKTMITTVIYEFLTSTTKRFNDKKQWVH